MDYTSGNLPNFKIEIVGDIRYEHTISNKTKKDMTVCIFNYRLNENDSDISAIKTAITILNSSTYSKNNKIIDLPGDCNPFITRTAYARVVVSANDTYSESKGKSLARAKAESKAYAVLSRVLNNFVNKQLKKLESAVALFNQKSQEVQAHNNLYLSE